MYLLPNEILSLILHFVSNDFCGFARVSKNFNSLYQAIKDERIKDEKVCFEHFSPFVVFTSYNRVKIFNKACKLGKKHVINYLIEKGMNSWNNGMCNATNGGHRQLMIPLFLKGDNYWNAEIDNAARDGHQQLVDVFIEKC